MILKDLLKFQLNTTMLSTYKYLDILNIEYYIFLGRIIHTNSLLEIFILHEIFL